MSDQHEPEQSSGQPAAAPPARTPAEAQFPYVAIEGLQPDAAGRTQLSRRPVRPSRRHRPIALIVIATLFGLAVTAAYLSWGPSPVLGSRSPSAARQVVNDYLAALARGDAAAALGYALTPPSDPSLLTDVALARSATPITDIVVAHPAEPGRVPVSYRLAGEPVSTVFELTLRGDVWRLNRVAAPVDLSDFPIPLQLNGQTPATSLPALFPGHYLITAAAPRYTLPDLELDLRHPFEQPEPRGRLELSEAGRAEVIAAARAKLADCLRQTDLDPPDCGFAVVHPDGTPLDESTVTWSVSGPADLTGIALTLDHAGSATAALDLTVHGDVRGVDGSRWRAEIRLTRLRADLTGATVQVQFG